MKKNTRNADTCARINFQMEISDLSASTNRKQSSLLILQIQSSNFALQP
eukprot:UN16731